MSSQIARLCAFSFYQSDLAMMKAICRVCDLKYRPVSSQFQVAEAWRLDRGYEGQLKDAGVKTARSRRRNCCKKVALNDLSSFFRLYLLCFDFVELTRMKLNETY